MGLAGLQQPHCQCSNQSWDTYTKLLKMFGEFIFILYLLKVNLLHLCVLQSFFSVRSPGQVCPPFSGAGLLQALTLDMLPPLHFLLQEDHGCHSLQPPSITLKIILIQTFLLRFQFTWNTCIRVDEPIPIIALYIRRETISF